MPLTSHRNIDSAQRIDGKGVGGLVVTDITSVLDTARVCLASNLNGQRSKVWNLYCQVGILSENYIRPSSIMSSRGQRLFGLIIYLICVEG